MKSIFELENRLDINKEFKKLVTAFYNDDKATLYRKNENYFSKYSTLVLMIDDIIFCNWKYRDTFLGVDEYMEHIGLNIEQILTCDYYDISKDKFLYFLEFYINMLHLIEIDGRIELSIRSKAYFENIPRILEKMNYKIEKVEDKFIVTKRNADVDSVLERIPGNIAQLLLEYNDFRVKDNIETKKKILKALDLYLDKDNKKIKNQIKSKDSKLLDSIETIVNNIGINHENDNKLYKSMSNKELIEWYDKCFLMMIHGIRAIEIDEIKKKREELIKRL